MALLIGVVLAILVGLLGTRTGLDRERAFYPVAMIVIASYYVLFAVTGATTNTLVLELLVAVIFVVVAVFSFRRSLWFVATALAAHGVFDLVHARLIANAGVPNWWPLFCLAFDVTAAAYLAWLIKSGRVRSLRAEHSNESFRF